MIDFKNELKNKFITIINEKVKTENIETISEEILETCIGKGSEKDGSDISIACFRIAKPFSKNPAEMALELKELIENDINNEDSNIQFIEKVVAVGPYVNVFYKKELVFKNVEDELINKGEDIAKDDKNNSKKVLLDYSSPNIAKQFHIGHLKTTVIGSMLYKLYKALGYQAVGINHLGDYGTQFGKLIEGYNMWKSEYDFSVNPIESLNDIYVRITAACKDDEELLEKCRDNFRKLEEKDPEMVKIWKYFVELSLMEFNKIYEVLNVKFDSYRGESAYSDNIPKAIEFLEEKNVLKESQGAKVVDLEEYGLGTALIQKSNGTSLYITRDILTFLYRINTYDFDKLLYVVASEQNLHFKQLFKIMELAGVDKKYIDGAKHVPYGMVSLPTGKMSTRLGNVIKIEELIEESIKRTYEKLEGKDNLTEEEKKEIAKKVGVGAVIFYNLSNQLIKDQVFVWENVLDFTGDTGPYVQYVNVRINSILNDYKNNEEYINEDGILDILNTEKNAEEKQTALEKINSLLKDEEFKKLLNEKEAASVFKKLYEFENILKESAKKTEPYILTNYLIALSKEFNQYYNNNKILTDDSRKRTLGIIICSSVSMILTKGMNILGIDMPTKM